MIKSGLGRATKQFFMTTTLHGFKYLCSGFHSDRVCWVSWCVASACCAGTLCAVLWARFLQVPALLTVRSATSAPAPLPAVAVCLPPASVAFLLVGHLSADDAITRRLTSTFSNILQSKETKPENLMLLDTLLKSRNVTLLEALYHNMPPCGEFAKNCRWQKKRIPCGSLFHRELTMYGVCCVMKSNKLKLSKSPMAMLDSSKTFRMVLQCFKPDVFFGCEVIFCSLSRPSLFFTMYEGEETVNTVTLVPGSEYTAELTFTSVQDSDSEELLTGSCVSSDSYSRKMCLVNTVTLVPGSEYTAELTFTSVRDSDSEELLTGSCVSSDSYSRKMCLVNTVTFVPGSEYTAELTFTSVRDSDSEELLTGSCVSSDSYSRKMCLVNTVTLVPGSEYTAELTFTSVRDSDSEELLTGSCVSSDSYSRKMCLVNTVTLVPGSEYTAELTFTSVRDSDSEELLTGSCVSSDSYSRKMCLVNTVTLVPGSEYTAELTFTSVRDSDSEELLTGSCVSSDSYSRKMCLNTCMERHCGCSNPLRTIFEDEHNVPPPCKLWQLGCLQRTENSSCSCLPSCKKISTALSLENNIMKSAEYTFDPLYQGINVSSETVIKLRVLEGGSKIFTRQPTETWFTLLSSLGGVFNMFLGVGLFSALELVLFLLVRVPAAMRTAPEMQLPGTRAHVTHVQARH
ncbi:uncharacterized protein LOC134806719 [Cydia splendana]|uniref:uncharacterized protein LOC134806719 n=1 Tax=Cydia splendana TaxID=1100963 RepID=UPI00300CAC33